MNINEGCLATIIGVFIMGFLFVGMFISAQWMNRRTCEERYASFDHKYSYWTGCVIKINDKWVPDESFYIKEDVR